MNTFVKNGIEKGIKMERASWLRGGLASFILMNIVLVFSAEAADKPLPKIVAEVNQARITNLAVKAEVHSYLRKIGHKELSPFRMAAVEKDALKKLIEEELLYQEGLALREEGVTGFELSVSETEIKAGVREIRDRFPSQQTYEDALSKEGLSMGAVRKGIERSRLIQKTWEALSSMSHEERMKRLKVITESAVIQIYPHPVARNGEKLAARTRR